MTPPSDISTQGCGKSTAARCFAADPANAHVIHVDLHGCSDYNAAAKRVADAIGYRIEYSEAEEDAKQAGFGIKDLETPWGPAEYDRLLRLFMRACSELKAAGKLRPGFQPTVLLDHASRPFNCVRRQLTILDAPPLPAAAGADPHSRRHDTLIYQTLESTKASDLADESCEPFRFVFITSDTTAERGSWESEFASLDVVHLAVLVHMAFLAASIAAHTTVLACLVYPAHFTCCSVGCARRHQLSSYGCVH